MMRKCVVLVFATLLAIAEVCAAGASDDLTGWQKAELVAVYPYALHQLPLTAIHEGSHALTARVLGDRPKVRLLPYYWEDWNGDKHLVLGSSGQSRPLSPARESLVLLAPYVVQALVVDRTTEWAYRRGHIRIDSFADKYVQSALVLNVFSPLDNSLFSKQGDFAQLGTLTHVHRIVWGVLVQAAYLVSANRILKARGHTDSTWTFYIHQSF